MVGEVGGQNKQKGHRDLRYLAAGQPWLRRWVSEATVPRQKAVTGIDSNCDADVCLGFAERSQQTSISTEERDMGPTGISKKKLDHWLPATTTFGEDS